MFTFPSSVSHPYLPSFAKKQYFHEVSHQNNSCSYLLCLNASRGIIYKTKPTVSVTRTYSMALDDGYDQTTLFLDVRSRGNGAMCDAVVMVNHLRAIV